ncbi:MAG: SDR family NAD(P)-dependent oxidoreductase [Promethearchaeota archaeon]
MEKNNFMGWENPGRVFISGASSGIGREYAKQLSEQGFKPIIHGRRIEKLKELKDEIFNKTSIESEIITGDLSDRSEIFRITEIIKKYDDLNVLINNAGFGNMNAFALMDLEENLDMLDVHVTATICFTHAALQKMIKKRKGVIINISSVAAFDDTGGQDIMYPSTKQFLYIFSLNLQMTLKKFGLRIQALCPGLTHTEIHSREKMKGFPLESLPESIWMNVEDVISQSLDAFKKESVVFIPGKYNRSQVRQRLNEQMNKADETFLK